MPDNVAERPNFRPRAAALVGPYGSGKSTLFEALLAAAGSARRAADSRTHAIGTSLAIAHCSFMGDRWALLDCPGSVEFAYESWSALAVADLAVVVCEPAPDKAVAVAPLLRLLREEKLPFLVFINKVDTMTGGLAETLAALQELSPQKLVLRQMPIRDGDKITGYVDLASERGYLYRRGQASQLIELPSSVRDAGAGSACRPARDSRRQ